MLVLHKYTSLILDRKDYCIRSPAERHDTASSSSFSVASTHSLGARARPVTLASSGLSRSHPARNSVSKIRRENRYGDYG